MAPKWARTYRNLDEAVSRKHERTSETDKGKAPMVEEPEEEQLSQFSIQASKEVDLYFLKYLSLITLHHDSTQGENLEKENRPEKDLR